MVKKVAIFILSTISLLVFAQPALASTCKLRVNTTPSGTTASVIAGQPFYVYIFDISPGTAYHLTAYQESTVIRSWDSSGADSSGTIYLQGLILDQTGNYTLTATQKRVSDPKQEAESCSTSLTVPPVTKSPSCPLGHGPIQYVVALKFCGDDFEKKYADKCCKVNSLGICINKNDPNGAAINKCDEIETYATIVNKDACSDPIYNKYDAGSKGCINPTGVTSTWALGALCTKPDGTPDTERPGIQTAIGCIPTGDLTSKDGFLSFLLKFAFGISGAIILFMIIVTGYTLLTSAGNPEKLQLVKENIVSILSGLILIAFSLILLQTIGADILQLPTFK